MSRVGMICSGRGVRTIMSFGNKEGHRIDVLILVINYVKAGAGAGRYRLRTSSSARGSALGEGKH